MIEMIAHKGIKEEDEDLAELLVNVAGKEKEDGDNDESSDWNLNVNNKPVKNQSLNDKGNKEGSKSAKDKNTPEIFHVDD